jgi:hypothetical protein
MSLVFESFVHPDMLDVLNDVDFVAAMLQFDVALASAYQRQYPRRNHPQLLPRT